MRVTLWSMLGHMLMILPIDTHDGADEDTTMAEDGEDGPQHQVLIRCTHGDHIKFSSRVSLISPSPSPLNLFPPYVCTLKPPMY